MNIFFGILLGLFCLMFLVSAHEFGHFIAARKNGVRVLEYGLCFPPRAVAWVHVPQIDKKGKPILKKNGKQLYKWVKIDKKDWDKPQEHLIFSINWLPIGGFCQMDGESDSDTAKGTFGASSFWSKTKILFAGVAFNWLIAIVVFTVLAWIGMPEFLENQFRIKTDETIEYQYVSVDSVIENSPAERAGFLPGDKIVSVNGEKVYSGYDEAFDAYPGQKVEYNILRAPQDKLCDPNPCPSEDLTLEATLNDADNEWGYLLGINMSSSQVYRRYTWSAPLVGIGTTAQITGETFVGLGKMLWQLISGALSQISFNPTIREAGRDSLVQASESVSGPVGIVGVIFPSIAQTGIKNILFMLALISVSLACMNVIPIPALDGGRWLMILISRLKHERLTKEKEERLVAKTMIGLLIFMAIVTILDIIRFF